MRQEIKIANLENTLSINKLIEDLENRYKLIENKLKFIEYIFEYLSDNPPNLEKTSSLPNSKEKAEGFGDLSNQKKINNQRKRKNKPTLKRVHAL